MSTASSSKKFGLKVSETEIPFSPKCSSSLLKTLGECWRTLSSFNSWSINIYRKRRDLNVISGTAGRWKCAK